MNIRRGLFRLWLVSAVLWTTWVGMISWPTIKSPYISRIEYGYVKDENRFIPVDSNIASEERFNMLLLHPLEFPNNVFLYSPDNPTVGDRKPYLKDFYDTYVQPRDAEFYEKRWGNVKDAILLAVFPIAAVFVAGVLFLWVVAGFKRSPNA